MTTDYLRCGSSAVSGRKMRVSALPELQAYLPSFSPPPKAAMEAREFIRVRLHQGRKKAVQEVNDLRKSIQNRVPYYARDGKTVHDKPGVKSILDKPEIRAVFDKPEVKSILDKPEVKTILWKLWKK